MKRLITICLQIVIMLIGIGVLTFLLWEPHVEGRNINATLFQIYFKDPFLAFIYAGSIPFFVALYQCFKFLQYTSEERVFSAPAVKAVQTIKYCALALICFIVVGEILIMTNESDDRAGGVMIGLFLAFVSSIVAAIAFLLEGILQKAVLTRQ